MFFIQLVPSVFGLALYQRLHTKLEIQQEAIESRILLFSKMQEKHKVLMDEMDLKFETRTTILKDEVALLEKDVDYIDAVDRRIGIGFTFFVASVSSLIIMVSLSTTI